MCSVCHPHRISRTDANVSERIVNEPSKLKAIEDYRKHPECLPELLGIQLIDVGEKWLSASLELKPHHLNPAHSSSHAATMVALSDTASGWGCVAHLPEGAATFTTVDLSCNLLRAVTTGTIICRATMLHGGRTTQVWDAIVADKSDKKLAAFRCTQLILYSPMSD